ncbi:MAG: DUF1761 domain-containing protein [Spirochaetaceae bacterium]
MLTFAANPLALIIAAAAYVAFGALWYSPALFADRWLQSRGQTITDVKDEQGTSFSGYAASIITSLLVCYGLAVLVNNLGYTSFVEGLVFGIFVWLVFNLPKVVSLKFFESRPLPLVFINGSYDLVAYALLGGFFALWG